MAKGNEILRNSYNSTNKSIKVSGSVYSGGVLQQLTTSQDLSADSLSYTTDIGENFIVKGLYLRATGEITQTVTLEYNGVKIIDEELTFTTAKLGEEFTVFAGSGEELTVTCTNSGTPAITLTLVLDLEVM